MITSLLEIAVWENKRDYPQLRGAPHPTSFEATRIVCLECALARLCTISVKTSSFITGSNPGLSLPTISRPGTLYRNPDVEYQRAHASWVKRGQRQAHGIRRVLVGIGDLCPGQMARTPIRENTPSFIGNLLQKGRVAPLKVASTVFAPIHGYVRSNMKPKSLLQTRHAGIPWRLLTRLSQAGVSLPITYPHARCPPLRNGGFQRGFCLYTLQTVDVGQMCIITTKTHLA